MLVEVIATTNPLEISKVTPYAVHAETVEDVRLSLPEPLRDSEHTRFWVNGREADLGDALPDGAVVVATTPAAGPGLVGKILIQLVIALVVAYVSYLLYKPPGPPRKRDDESSPTYGWTGITQSRDPYQPVEVSYGEIRGGGTVISEYIRSTYAPVSSTLYQLISFGWGEFESIAGITEDTPVGEEIEGSMLAGKMFINDNPIENYDDVFAQVRLGTNEQQPIQGFEQVVVPISVGPFELTGEETDGADNSASASTWDNAYWQNGGATAPNNDEHWDLYARTFDVTTEYDELVLRLRAGGGYYSSDNAGNLTGADFKYAVRYQELDISNNPITAGGDNNDGWFRMPPNNGTGFPTFSQQGLFDYEVRFQLRDPQVIAQVTPGNSFLITKDGAGGTNRAEAPILSAPASVGGDLVDGMYISFWFKIAADSDFWHYISEGSSTKRTHYLVGTDTATDGFRVWAEKSGFWGLDSPSTTFVWKQRVMIYGEHIGGSEAPMALAVSKYNDVIEQSAGEWHHVAFGWGTTTSRVRVAVNGTMAPGVSQASPPTWSGNPLTFGYPATGSTLAENYGTTPTEIEFDVCRVYAGELTSSQVVGLYNERNGPASVPQLPYISCEWKMNADPSPNTAVSANQTPKWWDDLDNLLGGGVNTDGGVIDNYSLGAFKRMKARVEIVRTNLDSTNTRTLDDIDWVEVQGVRYAQLTYPNRALLAYRIRATEQLGGGLPKTNAIVEAMKPPVWDGENLAAPAMNMEHSRNPAWLCLALLQGSKFVRLPGSYKPHLPSLKAWADYCDEVVYDGGPVLETSGSAVTGATLCENLWYDSSVADENGDVRGAFILHILYRDQGTGEVINAALPTEWEIGAFLRLRGWPTPLDLGTDALGGWDINSPSGSGGSDAGGYEIYEVGVDQGDAGLAEEPGYHVVKMYVAPPGEQAPAVLWAGQGDFVDDTSTAGSLTAATGSALDAGLIMEGGERRFEFNGTFDTARGGWDALQEIAAVGRAAPIKRGSEIYFRYTHKTDPSWLVTKSAVKEGSFSISYADTRERFNAFDFLFRNRSLQYENDSATYVDDDVINPTSLNDVRRDQRELFGVTRYGQAARQARFEASINRLTVRSGSFQVGPGALAVEVGDVFRISSDLLPRGYGGYCLNAPPDEAQLLRDGENLNATTWSKVGSGVGASSASSLGSPNWSVQDTTAVAEGYLYQDSLSSVTLGPGLYCLSGVFGNFSHTGTPTFALELQYESDSSKNCRAEFSLTGDGTATVSGSVDGGAQITKISGDYFCQVWFKFASSGRIRCKIIPDATGVSGTAGIEASTVMLNAGRYPLMSGAASGRGFVVDSEVTVAASDKVYIRDRDDRLVESEVLSSQFGTFSAGDAIFTASPLPDSVVTGRDDEFLLVTAGSELLGEVVSTRLGDGLNTKVEWIEYNDAAFEDRAHSVEELVVSDDDHGGLTAQTGEQRVPGRVSITRGEDWFVRSGSGVWTTNLRVSWEPDPADRWIIDRNRIWVRSASTGGRWTLIGETAGSDAFADCVLPFGSKGDRVEVGIQPVTRYGASRSPDRCGGFSMTISGNSTPPPALDAATERLQAHYALHEWSQPDGEGQMAVECRRGSWILGYRVFTAAPGANSWGATRDWSGSDFASARLLYRPMNPAGAYGPVTEVITAATPDLDVVTPDVTDPSMAWESFAAAGWERTVPQVGDPSVGAEFEQHADGYLRWTDASVQTDAATVWESSDSDRIPTSGTPIREPRTCFVEAYWEADQVHPITCSLAPWSCNSRSTEQWSCEGPAQSDTEAKLWMEANINETGESGGWTGWLPFQPGRYALADIRFRIRASRPSTGYNMRLRKLHTRITAPTITVEQAPPSRRSLESELF